MVDALREGRIDEGYVALFQDGNPPEFVAAEQAQIVQDRLRGIEPRNGHWGKYWWVSSEFTTHVVVYGDEVPF